MASILGLIKSPTIGRARSFSGSIEYLSRPTILSVAPSSTTRLVAEGVSVTIRSGVGVCDLPFALLLSAFEHETKTKTEKNKCIQVEMRCVTAFFYQRELSQMHGISRLFQRIFDPETLSKTQDLA